MHGSGGEKGKQRRHMWPVPVNATTVAADSSSSELFCKDGRKICVGDCALFKPPQDLPPFIGIIRTLTLEKEENSILGVNWLYRPADVKLTKGIPLDAAPNEVFYSFHKDEIPAASLLHPCKVVFLHKGVELPSGISSFVCRRVYDIENKCLWWLTDKDYIDERQEEVDWLLDKTGQEMHGAVQSGGRSPKPVNGPTSLKSSLDNAQNNSSFSSQVKGKRRERGDLGSDSSKWERLSGPEDEDPGQTRLENILKPEIAKITEKGGLVDFEGVEKLVQLMQPDSADKKIDLAARIMLVDVIAVTDRFDCLGWFVQLKGLPVLDEWLQEVHKGKIGDGGSPRESDKSVEEFLLALLRALDKLPVNLHALQTCNVGKSVNYLRSHKNSEIQKKARSLIDTWKKRVEAEMNINEGKSTSSRGVSWPAKPASSEVSHVGNKKSGGSADIASKNSLSHLSSTKSSQVKFSAAETPMKSSSLNSNKQIIASVGNHAKDQNSRLLVSSGSLDAPMSSIKEERSSSSSQSQNNSLSCSSDHAKAVGSCREDARSSTAGSLSANKVSNNASHSRKSSNGSHCSAVQKEVSSLKVHTSSKSFPFEKVSPTAASADTLSDVSYVDNGNNQRLIVRLTNTGCSPARGSIGGSIEDHAISGGKASPSAEKHGNHEKRIKGKGDGLRSCIAPNLDSGVCHDDIEGTIRFQEGNVSPTSVQSRGGEVCEKPAAANVGGSSKEFVSRLGKTYETSLSSINALIESCAKFSNTRDTRASSSPGDDVGMNLLASVAAGEISKSEDASPCASPGSKSPVIDESCLGNDRKLKNSDDEFDHSIKSADRDSTAFVNSDSLLLSKNERQSPKRRVVEDMSMESKGAYVCAEKMMQNMDKTCSKSDEKPGEVVGDTSIAVCIYPAKDIHTESDNVEDNHEQQKIGAHGFRSDNVSDSKQKMSKSGLDENLNFEHMDEKTGKDGTDLVSERAYTKAERDDDEKSPGSSLNIGDENILDVENKNILSSNTSMLQKPFLMAEKSASLKDVNDNNVLYSDSGNVLDIKSRAENAVNGKTGQIEQSELKVEFGSSASCNASESAGEILDVKEAPCHCSSSSFLPPDSLRSPLHENEKHEKSSICNSDRVDSKGIEEHHSSNENVSFAAAGSDVGVKLDFDLNEGFAFEDGSHANNAKFDEPVILTSSHVSCPTISAISSVSGAFHPSVTVAAAAKGPFFPPQNLLRSKGELGWKGSAATSAFRPAEPWKNNELPSNLSDNPGVDSSISKHGRPHLDIDLNVPDERCLDDTAMPSSSRQGCSESGHHDFSIGGLDLDLNRVDETPETGFFLGGKLDGPDFPSRFPVTCSVALSTGLASNGASASRDFDLNNGPGLDDLATNVAPCSQQIKSVVPIPSSIHGVRMNGLEFGSFSSWFPSGNLYSGITVPPFLPGRGDRSYVTAAGSQRMLGSTGNTPFGPEIYRGPVLPSSPAVAYPPNTALQFTGFPFETSFPLSSNSFLGSTAYMDSASGGPLCYPTIPSQLVGPAAVVSSTYPRPYVMNLPGGISNGLPESRKWGGPSLDLNSGPGSTDAEKRDEKFPSALRQLPVSSSQALVDEQMKVYQVPGGILKRKEPDSGWDGIDRFSYKQPSWQ